MLKIFINVSHAQQFILCAHSGLVISSLDYLSLVGRLGNTSFLDIVSEVIRMVEKKASVDGFGRWCIRSLKLYHT